MVRIDPVAVNLFTTKLLEIRMISQALTKTNLDLKPR